MRLRMKITVAGTFWNNPEGVKVGDIVDIPNEVEAELMIANGYAELANQGRRSEEHAVQQLSNEERAVLDTEIIGASHKAVPQPKAPRPPKPVEPKPEPEPKKVMTKSDVPEPVKRASSRPVRKPR